MKCELCGDVEETLDMYLHHPCRRCAQGHTLCGWCWCWMADRDLASTVVFKFGVPNLAVGPLSICVDDALKIRKLVDV